MRAAEVNSAVLSSRLRIAPRLLKRGQLTEVFWVVFGYGLAALAGIIGVRILTSLLVPAEYGRLALAMTIATLAQQVVFGPLSNASVRFFASSEEGRQLSAYFRATWKILKSTTVVFLFAVATAASILWMANLRDWCVFVLVASAFSLIFGWTSILNGMQNAARQRAIVALHGGVGQWLRFGIAAVFIVIFGRSAIWALVGYAAAASAILASQVVFFKREIQSRARSETVPSNARFILQREMMAYGLPFALWGIAVWAQQSADRWALETFRSVAEVGQYQALNQLAFQPILLWAGFTVQLITPIVFSWAGDGSENQRLRKAQRLNLRFVFGTLVLTGIISIIASQCHGFIFRHFVGPAYRSVSGMMAVMTLAGGFCAAGQVMSIALMTKKQTSQLLAPRIGCGAIGVVLTFAAAKYVGVSGVVWASLAAYCLYFVWVAILASWNATKLSVSECGIPARSS